MSKLYGKLPKTRLEIETANVHNQAVITLQDKQVYLVNNQTSLSVVFYTKYSPAHSVTLNLTVNSDAVPYENL